MDFVFNFYLKHYDRCLHFWPARKKAFNQCFYQIHVVLQKHILPQQASFSTSNVFILAIST